MIFSIARWIRNNPMCVAYKLYRLCVINFFIGAAIGCMFLIAEPLQPYLSTVNAAFPALVVTYWITWTVSLVVTMVGGTIEEALHG